MSGHAAALHAYRPRDLHAYRPRDLHAYRPRDLRDALETLARGNWRPIAGGTDLMVLLAAGQLTADHLLDISKLDALKGITVKGITVKGITVKDTKITIGALTTYSEIHRHPQVPTLLPLLVTAAKETGTLAIQNRGTIGGNIVNASPAADTPPVLLAYDTELQLVSANGERWVPYARFHTGYKQMDLRPDELLQAVRITCPPPHAVQYYRKVGTRRAQAIAKVGLAATALAADGKVTRCRMGLSSVAPTVLHPARTESLIENMPTDAIDDAFCQQAWDSLEQEVQPIDDIRSTTDYRRTVAGNLLVEFLEWVSQTA